MSKRQPQQPRPPRRNIPLRILVFLVVWIVVPAGCFALGLLVIGPTMGTVHIKQIPIVPDDPSEPRHANDWLEGQQLPVRLGPLGEPSARTRSHHKLSHAGKTKQPGEGLDNNLPPDDKTSTDQPTDQPSDQPQDQPKDNDKPSDGQPDGQKPTGEG